MRRRAGSRLHPTGLIAFENGARFTEWSFHTTASAGWSVPTMADYQNEAMGFNNNAGAGIGLALYRINAADFDLPSVGPGGGSEHSVHLRVTHGNSVTNDAYCLGPATACHSVPAVNGYAAVLINPAGTPQVALAKISAGVVSTLATANQEVFAGDVLSLAYTYDDSPAKATLSAMVNGVPVPGAQGIEDSSSPYDVDGVTNGRFGLFGNSSRVIQSGGAVVPEVAYEWWVTAKFPGIFEHYAEPPALPQTTSGFRILVMERQRFSNSPAPAIRRLISGAILSSSWSEQRIGGNRSLSAEFRVPDASGSEHIDARSFSDPSYEDWSSADWLGGEVILEYHYFDDQLDETQLPAFARDTVWRGRLVEISVDDQGVVAIQAEGLVGDLENLFVSQTFKDETIRTILTTILSDIGKGSEFGGFDTYIRYNPSKIVGVDSVLDTRIDVDFQWESVRSAMDRIFEYLPGQMVWGVDRTGEVFVSQEPDYYTEDNTAGGLQHFMVDGHSVKMDREIDLKRIRTSYVVLGEEVEDKRVNVHRVQGAARCERARQLFGLRGAVQQESNVEDKGSASKLAAFRLKGLTIPLITARLQVSRPVREERELWQALIAGAPKVAVTDRRSKTDLSAPTDEMGIDDYVSTEYTLRRYDDGTAYSCNEKGSAGGKVEMASVFREQVLDKDWLLHISVRNEFLHPGIVGDSCFLFGRPRNSSANEGWGSLWWKRDGASTGHLEWRYENGSATNRVIDTGISMNPIGLGDKSAHVTVYRDAAGVWHFYDGNTETATESGFTSDSIAQDTWGWKAFDHQNTGLGATQIDGDAALDQMWLIDTGNVAALNGGVTQLIADANGGVLPRARGLGLIRYLPMQEPAGAATRSLASWLDDGVAASPQVALATWTRSEASGTGDGAPVSNGARGVLVGKEKKWGGPLILSAESVSYTIDGSTGVLTRDFTLGESPSSLSMTIELLRQEVRRLNESRRRVEVGV